MSNSITDFLAAILSAKYGEQVRGAIHDAIELCYQDGKAGVNDLEARHLIEQVIGVNEMQDAGIETLMARVEALEQGGEGESAGTTTTTVPTFIVDSGIVNFSNVGANKSATEAVTFSKTFTEAPVVVCIKAFRNAANTFYSQVTAQPILSSITTTGCTLAVGNKYSQAVSPSVLWVAFQPTEIEINTEIIVPSGDGMTEAEVLELLAPISAALNGIKVGYDGTEYDTPGEAVRTQINDLHVLIGDEPGTAIVGTSVSYDGSDSGLSADNMQGAVDEVADELSSTNERLDEITTEVEAETATETNVASVTFTDATGGKDITSLVVYPMFSQGGTGDPSLQNIRQITGVSAVEVTNSGTETDISFVDENDDAVTVYGGTVDLVTGDATLTYICVSLTGDNVAGVSSNVNGTYARVAIPALVLRDSWRNSKSDKYVVSNQTDGPGHIHLASYSTASIWIFDDRFTDLATAKALLNADPVQFCYQPATPVTAQIVGTDLKTKQGQNVITVDSGNFSITYQTTAPSLILNQTLSLTEQMGEEIDEKIAESAPDVSGQIAVKIADASTLSTDALLYKSQLPDYYVTPEATPTTYDEAYPYMERRMKAIPDVSKSFVFITDTHWAGNTKHSTQMINYIRKRTGIRKVLFGGDILGNADSKYNFVKVGGGYLFESRQAFGTDYIPCVGDHDHNTVNVDHDDAHFVSYEVVHEMFMGDVKRIYHPYDPVEKLAEFTTDPTLTKECLAFFHTVYYVDDVERNMRIIVLNCGNGGLYGAMYDVFGESGTPLLRLQFDWLAETLMSTPAGMNICVLSHKLSLGGPAPNIAMDIISHFTRKTTLSPAPASSTEAIEEWWPHSGKTYDFTNAPDVGFVFCLDGHQHIDKITWYGLDGSTYKRTQTYDGETILDQRTKGQVPVIVTTCDALQNAETMYREAMISGTVTEQAFDIVTIEDDGVSFTRFGVGSDRKVYISKEA